MTAEVEYRCFVGGLAWATDDHSLGQAFSPFGDVVDSKIINDRETGRSRGFGFVTFSNEKAMNDAIEGMNGQDLDGRTITVNQAQPRGGGGFGSRGGGYVSRGWYGGGGEYGRGSSYRSGGGGDGGGRERSDRGYSDRRYVDRGYGDRGN